MRLHYVLFFTAISLLPACSKKPPMPWGHMSASSSSGRTLQTSPSATELYSLRERCSRDAQEWFTRQHADDMPPSPDFGVMNMGYQAHYSSQHNSCFIIQHDIANMKATHPKPASPKPEFESIYKDHLFSSDVIYDVIENKHIGTFTIDMADGGKMQACFVMETKCHSTEEWNELTKPYLVD
jgi:hypothetical protein